ncbi:MAG: hypothetical protein C3F19_07315 [Rhodocyclales bacterium]|nr:MAG: hypothetical protein C3F19_07315 [Rhodocyclales bacterium]
MASTSASPCGPKASRTKRRAKRTASWTEGCGCAAGAGWTGGGGAGLAAGAGGGTAGVAGAGGGRPSRRASTFAQNSSALRFFPIPAIASRVFSSRVRNSGMVLHLPMASASRSASGPRTSSRKRSA